LGLALGVIAVLVTALPASAATITSFSPSCGVAGTAVTITGTGFNIPSAATAVRFGATNQPTFTVASDTSITTTVPAGASTGTIAVDAPSGNTVSAASFVVATPAAATIASFAPTTGAVGSTVTITGTNFCGATAVRFNTTNALTYTVASTGTSITATVPAGATTGPLHVVTPSGTADSATSFTVGPAATLTFSPSSGKVGTIVTITGTNLTGATSVKFNGVAATTFSVDSATQITATVPAGATTGKIEVVAPSGTSTSTTDFTVKTVTKHSRTVTLALKKHLVASGTVKVKDGFNACRGNVTVKIQRLKNGAWTGVGSDKTSGNGDYKVNLNDKTGKYRAIAKKKTLNGGDDICVADTSKTVKHTH
jgi:hypothetical protein